MTGLETAGEVIAHPAARRWPHGAL